MLDLIEDELILCGNAKLQYIDIMMNDLSSTHIVSCKFINIICMTESIMPDNSVDIY